MAKDGDTVPSSEFLARIGQTPEGVVRGPDGRLTSSRRAKGLDVVGRLLNDEKYLESVKARLANGLAGPLEVYLWRYFYGEPRKDESERDAEQARYEQMRAELREFMANNREQARVLSAVVTRAPRLLPAPKLPPRHPRDRPERLDGPGQLSPDHDPEEEDAG